MAKVQTWVLQHPWIFDLVRGVLSLLLGLGAFIWRDHIVVILSLGIGLYLIVDGADGHRDLRIAPHAHVRAGRPTSSSASSA